MLRRFFNWCNWRGRFVYYLTFMVIGLYCGAVPEGLATTAVVKWDRSPSSDVAGYIVYHGTQQRQYEYEEDCGDVTECELFSLDDQTTYYIAVRAYNWVDQFSDYSDEVVYSAYNNDGGDCDGGGNPGDSCGAGKVLDCALNCVDSATAQPYIGDGYCDDGAWGYVLTCPEFNNDGGDCGGGNPGDSCGAGKVLDCALNCVDSATAQSYIGDGYCDDGAWGYVLTCPEFNNDGGDCGG